jgi:hypothetical protein
LGQLLLGKILRGPTCFDGLRHCNTKIFRLFNEASRRHFICFWRVNEIKTKQIFLLAVTYMKAVAIIRGIRDKSAIFQHNPISRLISCANFDRRAPNNRSDERAYTDSRVDRKPKDQSGTSNWLMILNSWQRSLKPF